MLSNFMPEGDFHDRYLLFLFQISEILFMLKE
jgi:hypothetical protein